MMILMRIVGGLWVLVLAPHALGDVIRVPQEHATIQDAIDASQAGDTILVSPGRYVERIRLKQGVSVRSTGDDAENRGPLARAEVTMIDGTVQPNSPRAGDPGVEMAESSTLDGFTITQVGQYDEDRWQQHFDSQGEELGDDEGAMHAEGTVPAVRIQGVSCTVIRCIVHHNGDVGIGVSGKSSGEGTTRVEANLVYRNMGGGIGVADGAAPLVRANTCRENLRAGIGCRNASPLVIENECAENVRAGIGCREGATPILRGNTCDRNRRAGIGIRMEGTAPVVEGNECRENEMAGIGCRDHASPLLRNNRCHHNKLAGIGCRDQANALIVGNECQANEAAGIGLDGQASATMEGNRCLENRLVAIGVTEGSTATIVGNHLARTGGVPPLVAVKDGSTALLRDNDLRGGGVAAVLVQGAVQLVANRLQGIDPKQGKGIWVWEQGDALIANNRIDGYRSAVNAKNAKLTIVDNQFRGFEGAAIVIQSDAHVARVFGNQASSADPNAKVVDWKGVHVLEADNRIGPQDVQKQAD